VLADALADFVVPADVVPLVDRSEKRSRQSARCAE
jgi:hypothetical protein